MPIEHHVHHDLGLVVSTLAGAIDDAMLLGAYRDLYGGSEWRPGFHELVDMRQADMSGVSAAALRDLSAIVEKSLGGEVESFRTAILALSDLPFGLARMYGTYADPLTEDVHVFRDVHAALDWLDVAPADRAALLAELTAVD